MGVLRRRGGEGSRGDGSTEEEGRGWEYRGGVEGSGREY